MNKNEILSLLKDIKSVIKDTEWEKSIFIDGDTMRQIYFDDNITRFGLVVTKKGYGYYNTFAEWFASKFLKYENPCAFLKKDSYLDETIIPSKDIPNFEFCIHPLRKMKSSIFYHTDEMNEEIISHGFTCDGATCCISTGEQSTTFNGFDVEEDLKNKILRMSCDECFTERPSNILKAAYLVGQYGFKIDKKTWFNMIINSKYLANMKHARVKEELTSYMINILTSENPYNALMTLFNCGAIKYLFPDLHELTSVTNKGDRYNCFVHTALTVMNCPNDLVTRFAALLHDIGKPLSWQNKKCPSISGGISIRFLGNFSLSQADKEKICEIVRKQEFIPTECNTVSDRRVKKIMTSCEGLLNEILDVAHASLMSHTKINPTLIPNIKERITYLSKLESKKETSIKPIVDGKEIMKHFNLKASPLIGHFLKEEKEFLKKNPNATKEEVLEMLKDKLTYSFACTDSE